MTILCLHNKQLEVNPGWILEKIYLLNKCFLSFSCNVLCLYFYLQTYELRQYEKSYWVATQIQKVQLTEEDKKDMFKKLLGYISGENAES